MQGMTNKLVFPKLKFLKTDYLVHPDDKKKKEVSVYGLDWSEHEAYAQKSFYKWVAQHGRVKDAEFFSPLPEEYDRLMKDRVFAISPEYQRAIRYHANQANEEWNQKWGFDTFIRELCLDPVDVHVKVAFRLVCDCIYNLQTHYYDRRDAMLRQTLHRMMIYKFWSCHTGRGLLLGKSSIPEPEREVLGIADLYENAVKHQVSEFERKMQSHHRNMLSFMDGLVPIVDVSPSKPLRQSKKCKFGKSPIKGILRA